LISSSSQSIFINHCRKIAEQLENCKPIWEEKLADLQNLLKDISSFQWSTIQNEVWKTFKKKNLYKNIP
jgi:hypothetical protein